MVNAERESLDAEYAAEIEKMRKAAASRPQDAPKTKATPSGSSVQQIVPTAPAKKDTTKLTDSKIATEVGGNRTYVSEARKLHSERPDLAKKVKAGTMSIPQADDHNELDPARRHVMSGPVSLVESANSFRGRIGPFSTKSPSFHDFPLFLAME